MKVLVIGLGKMGLGMAASLRRAGFEVFGHDSNPAAAALLADYGVQWVEYLAGLEQPIDAYVLSLPKGEVVRQVVMGEGGVAAHARPGALIIDTSTSDPATSRELATALQAEGIGFIDAPVSGGARGAMAGELTMFIGGAGTALAAAEPLLAALGSKRFNIGGSGAGNVGKILNNLLCASHLAIAAEAFKLGEAAGVPSGDVLEAINAGSGRSGVTLYNFPARILNKAFDSGFTMQLMRKDVGLATSLIAATGVRLPVCATVAQLWEASGAEIADHEDFNKITQYSGI